MAGTATFRFGDRVIGGDTEVFAIAELSGNHNDSFERAIEMVRAAAAAGATAVKVQTYTADSITLDSDRPEFRAEGFWEGRTLYDLYSEASMPWDWQATSPRRLAGRREVLLFGVRPRLDRVPRVDRGEATRSVVRTRRHPADRSHRGHRQADDHVHWDGDVVGDRGGGRGCTPRWLHRARTARVHELLSAPAAAANLRKIPHLADTFDVVSGLSDHTIGHGVATAAVALGASIVEKHFTLRRADGGVDTRSRWSRRSSPNSSMLLPPHVRQSVPSTTGPPRPTRAVAPIAGRCS